MKIFIDKTFEKDTNNITDTNILKKISSIISSVQKAEKLSELKNLKKLKGFKKEYRIRLREYRIGLIIEDKIVIFVRCLHRKDIYNYFPK